MGITRILLKLKNYAINQIIKRAITVSPKTTLLDARSMLLRHRISRLVVIENEKPVGIITEKDLVKAIYRIDNKIIENVRVYEIITKRLLARPLGSAPTTLSPSTAVRKAASGS